MQVLDGNDVARKENAQASLIRQRQQAGFAIIASKFYEYMEQPLGQFCNTGTLE